MVALAPMEPHLAFTKQTSLQIYACMHTLNSHPPTLFWSAKVQKLFRIQCHRVSKPGNLLECQLQPLTVNKAEITTQPQMDVLYEYHIITVVTSYVSLMTVWKTLEAV